MMDHYDLPYGRRPEDDAPRPGIIERAFTAFEEEFMAQARFAIPWIGRGFYLAIGFMFAMASVHNYFSKFLHWGPG